MARSFAITLRDGSAIPMQDGSIIAKDPVRATVVKDPEHGDKAYKGQAEIVFVVTNTTDRPIRGLAKVVPLGETKQEAISIKGEDERDFAARQEQEFTVSFDVPVSESAEAKPAGSTAPAAGARVTPEVFKYPFRFDVASVLNPQEDFTTGPVVTVEVVPPLPTPQPKKWWIFAIIGGVLLIGIVVAIILAKSCGGKEPDGDESPTPTPVESPTETPTEAPTVTPTAPPPPTPAPVDHQALERECFNLVQGRIAWNYTNSTTWSPTNIQNLCRGTTNPSQPPDCFRRVMHTGINWGGGTRWQWQNALNLCTGTNDANRTISCFQSRIAQRIPWQQAIPQCK